MFISPLAYATNISIFSDILSKYFIQLHLQPFLLTQSFWNSVRKSAICMPEKDGMEIFYRLQ